jgi:hypothetical protein
MFDPICIQSESGHELLLIACEPDIPQLVIHEGVGKHGQQRTIFVKPCLRVKCTAAVFSGFDSLDRATLLLESLGSLDT